MGLSVIEIIERCGIDNVRVQGLTQCFRRATRLKTGDWEITFGTAAQNEPGGDWEGMIVWLPRKKVNEILGLTAPGQGGRT